MSSITIRPATTQDIGLLTELGRITFTESFSTQNNPANFEKHLSLQHVFPVIELEFLDPSNQFFIADHRGDPAGFFKIIFNSDEDHSQLKNYRCLQLERIYILKKYQGLGIARLMLEQVTNIAREHSFEIIWLGVWEKNEKANKIYEHWGFEKFGSHIFNLGGDLQTDFLMKKKVNPEIR